ncbi:MAG: DUF6456 domain-containing protein [Rhodoblastus sp.]
MALKPQKKASAARGPARDGQGEGRELLRPDLGRDARRLLSALAQEGASPARADLRDGFLVVAAPRNGVTSIVANASLAAGRELVEHALARWTAHTPPRLELASEGASLARRLAAPAGVSAHRAQHGEFAIRSIEPGARPVLIDEAESPLAWLARRKGRDGAPFLSPAQVEAGERFRRDVEIAQIRQRVTSDWSGAAGSGRRGPQDLNVSDLAIAARQRLARAAEAVGAELANLLIDVCGLQKGLELVERERAWPPRSAKVVLKIALETLAAYYGLASAAQGPERAPLRGWGADDYRPRI